MGNRLMWRARKKHAAKRLRRMVQRIDDLRRSKGRNKLRVPLDAPVLWGYRRCLVLRPDAARRSDSDRLLALLAVVQKVEDCKRKDFKRWDYRIRRWEQWRHTPRKLSPREYEKLPAELKCYFSWIWSYWKGKRYVITHDWMFATRRSKLYLTHRFIPDVEIEQELSYLRERIDQGRLWGKYRKIKCRKTHSWRGDSRRRKLRDHAHRQEIRLGKQLFDAGELALERGKEVNADAKT